MDKHDFIPASVPVQGGARVNALTVDVEDYFQVSAFESRIGRDDWRSMAPRIERNVERILSLFEKEQARGTFFTLGWVARRFPHVVRAIVEAGHELASHGLEHKRVTQQTPDEFRADIDHAKKLLEDVSGQPVVGYRAASYSIGEGNLWAHELLAETGHRYSSSIYPVRHDLYGMPHAPRFAFRLHREGIVELPVTTLRIAGRNFPCGGGGFFRLYPYAVSRWAFDRINTRECQPGILYFHPWEIDPDQPRMRGLDVKTRFRHYLNLSRMEHRVERLLTDFRWDRMDRVFAGSISASE
ncbi:MAG TPA: XrtA system polysaccharide deacetylase [Gammaproteobacteria bacterium]|nr:XrtA system polysaccharide deacetylase [Gammaproteobacteria bacterium]